MFGFDDKLEILADAAKYDVSCSSSGGKQKIMVGSEMPLPVEFAIPILKMEDAFHYLRF